MTAKSESLQSNRPDNKHMNVWELYILDTIDWNVEAKATLLLWETISVMNEILAMAFEFWQPDISHDIKLFKEGNDTSCTLTDTAFFNQNPTQIYSKSLQKCKMVFIGVL